MIPLGVPIERVPGAAARDIAALAYAGNPHKRGLEVLAAAWARVGLGRAARRRRDRGRRGRRAWLARHGVPEPAGIEWVGVVPRPEWLALLGRARLYVNASRFEDHGIAPLEALSAGAALVSLPTPGPYPALRMARALGAVAGLDRSGGRAARGRGASIERTTRGGRTRCSRRTGWRSCGARSPRRYSRRSGSASRANGGHQVSGRPRVELAVGSGVLSRRVTRARVDYAKQLALTPASTRGRTHPLNAQFTARRRSRPTSARAPPSRTARAPAPPARPRSNDARRDVLDRRRSAANVPRRHQRAHRLVDDLRHAADARGDHRQPARQRLEQHDRQVLELAREHEHVGRAHPLRDLPPAAARRGTARSRRPGPRAQRPQLAVADDLQRRASSPATASIRSAWRFFSASAATLSSRSGPSRARGPGWKIDVSTTFGTTR